MSKTIGNLTVRIGADTKQFTNAMRRTQRQSRGMSKQFAKMGQMVAGAFSVYAAGSVVKNAIQKNIEFEKAMADVQAITKATASEISALEKDALELGRTTEHTASAVASLQKEFGKLGFSTKEILAATGATLDLATATGEELAASAETAGATIRGFGLDAEETRRVVDLMAASFTSSALDLTRFGDAMRYIAPVARAAGVDIETATAHMAALADAGIHGSMAGTALRKIYSELTVEGKSMNEVIGELSEKNIGLAEAQELVQERAKAALLVLTNNIGKIRNLKTAYDDAGGSAADMAEIQRNTLSGSIDKLKSAYEGLILSMKEGNGVLKEAVDGLTSLIGALRGDTGGYLLGDSLEVVPMSALDNVNRFVALVYNKFGNARPLEAFDKYMRKKWAKINKDEKEAGDEFANLSKETLEKKMSAYDTQMGVFTNLIQKYRDEENQTEEQFYWRQYSLAKQSREKIQEELDKRIQNNQEAAKATDTWADSLGELKKQLSENNAAILETKNLDEAKHLQEVNKELEKEIARRERLLGLRESEATAGAGTYTRLGSKSAGLIDFKPVKKELTDLQQQQADFVNASASQATQYSEVWSNAGDSIIDMSGMIANAVSDAASRLGEAIGKIMSGSGDVNDVFDALIGVVAQFMQALGSALVAAGVAAGAFEALLATPPLAVAAGLALIAAAGIVRGIMSGGPEEFADGGIISGPTLGLVGEYSGARNNPEVIAPLDKLQSMMSSGTQKVEVVGRIRGTDLKLVMDKYNDKVSQYT